MIKKVTASEKKKLKERLRKLDKKLHRLYWFTNAGLLTNRRIFPDMCKELLKLDEKRKKIRNKLK